MIGMEHIGITEEQLNGLGNRWAKKDGEVRWYVNDWQDAIGMEVVYYKTGNVSDVYYHGGNGWHGDGHPSNSWYYKNVAGTKVWIDIQGRVHVDYCKDAGVERDIVAKVGERVQAVLDAQAPVEVVVEVCAQAEAQADVEEAEAPAEVAVLVEREDGQQARVMVPDAGEDVWACILEAYPTAYDLIDEGRILVDDGAGYGYDASFGPGEDEALAMWLAEGVQHYCGGLDESDATIEADRREGMAVVTWDGEDGPVSQAINLNEGDMEKIVLGADPVAEGWEDGIGRQVCKANAGREGGQ